MPRFSTYLVILAVVALSTTLQAAPLGTAFTYQGKLVQNDVDVTDLCDFSFILWDSAAGGVEVAGPIDVLDVPVTEGTFTARLNFGGGTFEGDASWLEISVACPAGGGLTTLSPRQELTPTPNALFAESMMWQGLLNIPADIDDGDDVDDADADASNELQDLHLMGNLLTLTDDATPVNLGGFLDNTDNQTLADVLGQGNNAGGASISNIGTTTTNALTVSGLNCTGNANGGALTTNASGDVVCSDDDGGAGGGNTLDQAYDQGGPGAGRVITADAGTVTIRGANARALELQGDFDPTLRVSASSSQSQDTGIQIVGARNATTNVDAAYIELRDFDDNEGIEGMGTEFTMARIGAGMQDVSGSTGFLRFYTNAGADLQERMRIDKLGAVSIGSESGTERFKVAGDVSIGGGTTIGMETGDSEYLRIRGFIDAWYLGVRNIANGSLTNFFIGQGPSDFHRFHFSQGGNLGLGTEPAADLHLASTGSQQIWIEADSDNSNEAHQPSILMTQDGGIITGELGFFDSSNSMSLRTDYDGGASANILLQPDGRVGVGNSSPQTMLDVKGEGTSAGGVTGTVVVSSFQNTNTGEASAISIDAQTDEDSLLFFSNGGTATWDIRTDVDHPDFLFPLLEAQYIGGAGVQDAIRLIPKGDEDGFNIVPGEDNETSLGNSASFLGAWSNVVTYDLTNLSDARLKTDVRDLDYGIETINKLRPVRFRWSARPENGSQLGVIAQEVAPVIPEIVNSDESDPDHRLTVNYIELVPVLIRAIQEQQQEIELLRARVENLELNDYAPAELP